MCVFSSNPSDYEVSYEISEAPPLTDKDNDTEDSELESFDSVYFEVLDRLLRRHVSPDVAVGLALDVTLSTFAPDPE